MNIAIAITGASGAVYARKTIETLAKVDGVTLYVVFSEYGEAVAKHEEQFEAIKSVEGVNFVDGSTMFSTLASGSSLIDAVVVVPCSASTLGRIANGCSNNLVTRAADVMLKERRKLILCLRETPLSAIHIENMAKVTAAGAVVMPLSPSFYSHPKTVDELIFTQVERVVSLLGVQLERYVFEA